MSKTFITPRIDGLNPQTMGASDSMTWLDESALVNERHDEHMLYIVSRNSSEESLHQHADTLVSTYKPMIQSAEMYINLNKFKTYPFVPMLAAKFLHAYPLRPFIL
jgi:hypothetical protein